MFAKFIDSKNESESNCVVHSFHFIQPQCKYAQAKIKYERMTESLTIERVNIIRDLMASSQFESMHDAK